MWEKLLLSGKEISLLSERRRKDILMLNSEGKTYEVAGLRNVLVCFESFALVIPCVMTAL